MKDPWEFVAYPVASVTAVGAADMLGGSFSSLLPLPGEYAAAAVVGLIVGFVIDDMLPAYIKHARSGGSGGGGDIGGGDMGGGGDDFDFD